MVLHFYPFTLFFVFPHSQREVDRKDAIINLLIRNLDEADEQMQVAQRAHMSQTDRLVDLHESRLTVLENEFEAELHTIRTEFDSELYVRSHHIATLFSIFLTRHIS
jgi:hypothetical protein